MCRRGGMKSLALAAEKRITFEARLRLSLMDKNAPELPYNSYLYRYSRRIFPSISSIENRQIYLVGI